MKGETAERSLMENVSGKNNNRAEPLPSIELGFNAKSENAFYE